VASFVIVHGAFGGGWEWTPVARLLRQRGHEVFTPTLTGMGERSHVAHGGAADLSTHIADVTAVLEFEDLQGVVLCGASYGGMAVIGAADRASKRVALVIYIDAPVPRDGQSGLDLLPETFGAVVRDGIHRHGPGWRVPMAAEVLESSLPSGSVPAQVRERVAARIRPHPAATFTEVIHLSGAVERLPRAFIRCTGSDFAGSLGGDPVEPSAARARAEGWLYRELAAPHDPHLFDAAATSVVLDELAEGVAAAPRVPAS
jgi:pimeloyl-ACP methyl ester carboxylesterase